MAKVQLNKPNPIQLIRMHNRLKEFEELLLDNTLLKVSKLRGQKSQMEGVVANSSNVTGKGVTEQETCLWFL